MKYLRVSFFLEVTLLLLIGSMLINDASASSAQLRTIFIFVYDAGETIGLLPITPLLEAENVAVQWVPLTPWSLRILLRENQSVVKPPEDLDKMAHVKDRQLDGEIAYWLNLATERKPDLIILGLVSRIQEQLAEELGKHGMSTVGFYDGFDPTDRNSIIWRVSKQVREIWVPSRAIKRNLNHLGLNSVKVMGQPSLESWYQTAMEIKPDSLLSRLKIPPSKKIVIFAGQYGEGYTDILEAFLKAAVSELNGREELYLVLSPHPKTTGEAEQDAMKKHGHPRISILPKEMSTAEVAAICAAMITWRSTVGVQATFMGKPVIYFNFNLNDYRNDLIDEGIAQAATPKTFSVALQLALTQQSDASVNRNRLAKLGYIIDADQKIAFEIIKHVHKH